MELDAYITPDKSGKKVLRWESIANLDDSSFWREVYSADDLEFDLYGIDIFSHDGLIWLCTISLYRRLMRLRTYLTLPNAPAQIEYLRHLGLDQLKTTAGFNITNEYLLEADKHPHRLKPPSFPRVTSTNEQQAIQFVSERFWLYFDGTEGSALKDELARQLSVRRGTGNEPRKSREYYEDLDAYVFWLREMVKNIILHAGERGNGYGFIAHSPMPRTLRKLRFACGDAGPGLQATLQKQYPLKFDDTAHAVAYALLLRGLKEYIPDGTEGFFPALQYVVKMMGSIHIRTSDVLCSLYLDTPETRDKVARILARVSDSANDITPELSDALVRAMRKQLRVRRMPEIIGFHIAVDLFVS